MKNNEDLNIKSEVKRKVIHLSCSILPILYYFYQNTEIFLLVSGILSIVAIMIEIFRFKNKAAKRLFNQMFGTLLRHNELERRITGATLLFISMTVSIYIFRPLVAIPSLLFLTISDSLAAITGKYFGKHKFLSKSIEGSITFYLVSLIIIYIFIPQIGTLAIAIVLIISVIEALQLPIDDNILIPIFSGLLISVVI